MNKLDIKEFIPSKTFKDYITKNNIELDDRQKAKLIYRSRTSIRKKLDGYMKLMKETSNPVLAEHLENLVMYEERLIESVYKRVDDAVYVLTIYNLSDDGREYEDDKVGIYKSIISAEKIGKKCKEKSGFKINMCIVAPLTNEEQSRIENEMETKGYINDGYDMYISYNSSGEITYIDTKNPIDDELYNKHSKAENYIGDEYFMDLPIPFKNGDIVEGLDPNHIDTYGIIFIPDDMKEHDKRLMADGYTPDDEMRVEFIYDNGEFGHSHILITDMDLVDDMDEIPQKYRMTLACASDLVKGKGGSSIGWLQYFIDKDIKNK